MKLDLFGILHPGALSITFFRFSVAMTFCAYLFPDRLSPFLLVFCNSSSTFSPCSLFFSSFPHNLLFLITHKVNCIVVQISFTLGYIFPLQNSRFNMQLRNTCWSQPGHPWWWFAEFCCGALAHLLPVTYEDSSVQSIMLSLWSLVQVFIFLGCFVFLFLDGSHPNEYLPVVCVVYCQLVMLLFNVEEWGSRGLWGWKIDEIWKEILKEIWKTFQETKKMK